MASSARVITAVASHGLRVGRMEMRAGAAWLNRRLAQYLPSRPRIVQLPINDICNSRCTMCNIWQRKRDHEITPAELDAVLRDSLFRAVRYVGLSGGEPTLRRDLPEIGRVLCDALPRLEAVNIITNALRAGDVVHRIIALRDVVAAAGKTFTVSVSLDGVGGVHDENRGVPGNFAAAVTVIDALREAGVRVGIGCTLTPINAYHADDLLDWCERRDLDFVFRLGVEIERVYNEGYNLLHPLTPAMRFHLAMFFDKLAQHPRVSAARRRFNRSLADQLAFGAPRAVGCHWQTDGVTLDTRGGISYCSVRSPVVGSALQTGAWRLFRQNIRERRRIVAHDCSGCRHDLAGPPLPGAMARDGVYELMRPLRERARWRKARRLHHHPESVLPAPGSAQPARHDHPSAWRHVLITGWYGSETTGDKAILGEIAHVLRSAAPQCRITVTTIDRKVSAQTRRELPELADSAMIDLPLAHRAARDFDAVILGGGPIQPMGELEHVWNIFRAANRARAARVIFGCGVGELSGLASCYARGILQYATAGFLRDAVSRQRALELGGSDALAVGCDPALRYVRRWALRRAEVLPRPARSGRLAGLVRANTGEYVRGSDRDALEQHNARAAEALAQIMEPAAQRCDAVADLLPMCALPIGGDDRLFNRRVAAAFTDPSRVRVERAYLTLDQTLRRLADADAAVAMRYHGHLFCLALGVPLLSIDYTGENGKVQQLVERIGWTRFTRSWADLRPATASAPLSKLVTERSHWSRLLLDQAEALIRDLERAYVEALGVRVEPCAAWTRAAA